MMRAFDVDGNDSLNTFTNLPLETTLNGACMVPGASVTHLKHHGDDDDDLSRLQGPKSLSFTFEGADLASAQFVAVVVRDKREWFVIVGPGQDLSEVQRRKLCKIYALKF
jgi:hypothetical protein